MLAILVHICDDPTALAAVDPHLLLAGCRVTVDVDVSWFHLIFHQRGMLDRVRRLCCVPYGGAGGIVQRRSVWSFAVDGAPQGEVHGIMFRGQSSGQIGARTALVRWCMCGRRSIKRRPTLNRRGQRRREGVGIKIRRVGVFPACGARLDLAEMEVSSRGKLVGALSRVL
jgi:hypothetical protein